MPNMLPVSTGARLLAATAAVIGGRAHTAIVLDEDSGLISLYVQEGEGWLPMGELRVPGAGAATRPSLAFVGEEILVTTGEGFVLRQRLSDGATTASERHAVHHEGAVWQAACATQHGQLPHVAHLRLRHAEQAWMPEILTAEISALSGSTKPAFFQ